MISKISLNSFWFTVLTSFIGAAFFLTVGSVYGEESVIVTEGIDSILGSAKAVYGAIVGAGAGYGFSQRQARKDAETLALYKDGEITRLTAIEIKYNALSHQALAEKLKGN